jgi:uncharacterized membrane protein YccF (DUF307 family)
MSPLSVILNILWLVCGGAVLGLGWLIASLIMFVSILGIPWGRGAFNIAVYTFLPFSHEAVRRNRLTRREDIGTGPLGFVGNVIWFLLAGLWLAIAHLMVGTACFLSIIGIPFGIVHVKLVWISMTPIGMTVVPSDMAEEMQRRQAEVGGRQGS